MGHNEHFLERAQQRLDFHQMDRAMSLYRDPAFVRDLLAILKLSDGVQRVALELEPGDDGPYVVVDRDGTLVTCLAKGMTAFDTRVVRKAELDGLFARGETMRARQRALAEVTAKEGGSTKLLKRLQEGPRVSRETISALLALAPLQGFSWYRTTLDFGEDLDLQRHRLLARHGGKKEGPEAIEAHVENCWTHAHLFALSLSHGLPKEFETLPTTPGGLLFAQVVLRMARQQLTGPFQRGLWALSSVGGPLVAGIKKHYRSCEDIYEFYTAVLGLFGIGRRSQKWRGELRKLLEKGPQMSREGYYKPSVVEAMEKLSGGLASMLDDPEDHVRAGLLKVGRDLTMIPAEGMPADHPLHFKSPEEIPADWATAYLFNIPYIFWRESAGMNLIHSTAGFLATSSLEELYLPEAALELVGAWHPSFGATMVKEMERGEEAREPVTAAPKVGRNDPCSCGSGEKFKKCCMGKAS